MVDKSTLALTRSWSSPRTSRHTDGAATNWICKLFLSTATHFLRKQLQPQAVRNLWLSQTSVKRSTIAQKTSLRAYKIVPTLFSTFSSNTIINNLEATKHRIAYLLPGAYKQSDDTQMHFWNNLACIVLPGVECELISRNLEWGNRLPFQHLVEIEHEGVWNNRW